MAEIEIVAYYIDFKTIDCMRVRNKHHKSSPVIILINVATSIVLFLVEGMLSPIRRMSVNQSYNNSVGSEVATSPPFL